MSLHSPKLAARRCCAALKAHVASVSVSDVSKVCFKCFNGCCKVDRDVAHVAYIVSVSDECCKHFDLDVAYVSHVCCKSMFQLFHLFQSYVAASVFILQIVSVLS
jgi:hypothetical protein